MKKYTKEYRKLKQPKLANPLPSLDCSRVLKPPTGDVPLIDYMTVNKSSVKNNVSYAHKVPCNAAVEPVMQEQPIVRRITVDLRPVLREVIDQREEEVSGADNESDSISRDSLSDQGSNREIYSHSQQDLQSENSPISTSQLYEQGPSGRYVSREEPPPIHRNSEAISCSLPSLQNCASSEKISKPEQKGQRGVNLVEITNPGQFTCDKEQQLSVTAPGSFHKIILKGLPSQKMPKEQRSNVNTSRLELEKLQLPISELVRVIKEQTNSEQHTLIAQVLCSLRGKQEDTLKNGILGRANNENSQKIPQIPRGGEGIRLLWSKRK